MKGLSPDVRVAVEEEDEEDQEPDVGVERKESGKARRIKGKKKYKLASMSPTSDAYSEDDLQADRLDNKNGSFAPLPPSAVSFASDPSSAPALPSTGSLVRRASASAVDAATHTPSGLSSFHPILPSVPSLPRSRSYSHSHAPPPPPPSSRPAAPPLSSLASSTQSKSGFLPRLLHLDQVQLSLESDEKGSIHQREEELYSEEQAAEAAVVRRREEKRRMKEMPQLQKMQAMGKKMWKSILKNPLASIPSPF